MEVHTDENEKKLEKKKPRSFFLTHLLSPFALKGIVLLLKSIITPCILNATQIILHRRVLLVFDEQASR
jgi:hypothetical protein